MIFAESTREVFEHIGEENHLSEEKVYELGRVAGLVLLGFLHRDDTRKELQEALAINPMIANELQNELNKKLFAPIADLLDKIYSPLSKNTINSQKVIDSIIPAKPVSLENMPKPVSMPIAPQSVNTPAPKPAFLPSVPPASFSNVPAPVAVPTMSSSDSIMKKSPLVFTGSTASTPAPTTTPAPTAPKPMTFVTQTNSQSVPMGNVPKFKIETPGTMTGSAFGGTSTPAFSSAPRPAKIELGFTSPDKKLPVMPSTTFETQKSSVRYGVPTAPSFASELPKPEEKITTPTPAKIPPTPPSFGGGAPKPLV